MIQSYRVMVLVYLTNHIKFVIITTITNFDIGGNMDFHQTFTKSLASGGAIDYGIVLGNKKIVFIKRAKGDRIEGMMINM